MYVVDLQSLHTDTVSILLWISDKCNMRRDYEFVLTLVRSVVCSIYLCRDVDFCLG